MSKINNEYFDLIKTWCDRLIDYQVTEHSDESFVGGILCPSCMGMHGRIGDAMYPFVFVYENTGDKKYYNAARLIFKWTMRNMLRDKGQIINDANSTWYGITVFFNISLGELLFNLKDSIEDEDYNEWMAYYLDSSEYIYNSFYNNTNWNINYRVATATSMAIAWKVFGDKKYYDKAREFAKISVEHITDEGFLYGENKPTELPTGRGFRPVDLGYNVEESLPNLTLYLKYIGEDEETKKVLIHSMKAHLKFMLPDGGWDNTWGTRSNKWSYWGSRTSDGCQPAYAYFCDEDETFFEAAHRNYECLKRCTVDGFLAGGIHHAEMNEPCCVHHSFCHIKGLIPLAESEYVRKNNVKLPRETLDGITDFTSMNVSVSTKGDWTATYSCDDYAKGNDDETPTGGAVTLLYHNKIGIVLGGGPNEFKLAEAHNMQVPRFFEDVCQLARLEHHVDGKKRRNTYDATASVYTYSDDNCTTYTAKGMIKEPRFFGTDRYEMKYTMTKDDFEISVFTEAEGAKFILPVVATPDEKLEIKDNTVTIDKKGGILSIESSEPVIHNTKRAERIFNMWGGLATAHLVIDVPKNKKLNIKFTVK